MNSVSLINLQQRCQQFLEIALAIPEAAAPAQIRLAEAMRYAALNGGKRMRAMLVYATGILFDTPLDLLDYPAAAVELIHAYSLVHDDLPAMDDSPLRRGVPTCHLAFDEALAILAGDTMQSLAFELLSKVPLAAAQVLAMLRLLAQASGLSGMAGGQAIDLAHTDTSPDLADLTRLHDLKTGQLIIASVQLGAMCGGVTSGDIWLKLTELSRLLGLAFQIRDDMLDVISPCETLGKPVGLDLTNGKYTFIDLLGMEDCQQMLDDLAKKAYLCLDGYPYKSQLLFELIDFTVNRKY